MYSEGLIVCKASTIGISCVGMITLCPRRVGEVGFTHPGEPLGESTPPPKIARRKRAKSSITQPWIIRFRSNFVQSLNA